MLGPLCKASVGARIPPDVNCYAGLHHAVVPGTWHSMPTACVVRQDCLTTQFYSGYRLAYFAGRALSHVSFSSLTIPNIAFHEIITFTKK
eukprot:1161741-Pelagomonas_calceolata.AAC.6